MTNTLKEHPPKKSSLSNYYQNTSSTPPDIYPFPDNAGNKSYIFEIPLITLIYRNNLSSSNSPFSFLIATPTSVTMASISSEGVTSNEGFQVFIPGAET